MGTSGLVTKFDLIVARELDPRTKMSPGGTFQSRGFHWLRSLLRSLLSSPSLLLLLLLENNHAHLPPISRASGDLHQTTLLGVSTPGGRWVALTFLGSHCVLLGWGAWLRFGSVLAAVVAGAVRRAFGGLWNSSGFMYWVALPPLRPRRGSLGSDTLCIIFPKLMHSVLMFPQVSEGWGFNFSCFSPAVQWSWSFSFDSAHLEIFWHKFFFSS